MNPKICLIMTDAISFNVLCNGQLEYIKEHSDFDITLICGGDKSQLDKLKQRDVGKVINANLERQPSLTKDIKSLVFLINYLATNRFDVVVYSTPKALLLGSIASLVTGQKVRVAIVRGRVYENYTGKKRQFYELLDKMALAASSEVVFISKSLKSSYTKDKLISKAKSLVLGSGSSNGVNVSRFINKKSKDRDASNFNVLTVGRICEDKGLYDLAEVISKVKNPNISFLLVGQIEDERSGQFLNKMLINHKNLKHVSYTENVVEYFQDADLHLFLTHREGFGNVAIEAASCNLPTFAYDVVGVRDSVCNGKSGKTFKFKDNTSIAEAIDNAAENTDFCNEYKESRSWVIDNFEQKKVWNSYLKFYSKFIED